MYLRYVCLVRVAACVIELYCLTLILLHQANIIAEVLNDLTQSSIITMAYPENRLGIYDSIFRGNLYNKPEVQVSLASLAASMSLVVVCLCSSLTLAFYSSPLQLLGSAVETGGPLIIENTCFLDNEFLKYAPVILHGSQASLTASGNYGNVIGDEDLACDFAILFQSTAEADFSLMKTNADFMDMNNFTCVDFNATECANTATPEPTTEPSMAPSRRSRFAPTPEPTILPGTPAPVAAMDAPTPTAGAAGRAITSLSAAAAALTAYFVF